jgi:hypothetical protein
MRPNENLVGRRYVFLPQYLLHACQASSIREWIAAAFHGIAARSKRTSLVEQRQSEDEHEKHSDQPVIEVQISGL